MAYDLDQIRDQAAEAVGGAQVEFTFAGATYTFPHPALADDDLKDDLLRAETETDASIVLLGEQQWEKYQKAGGQAGSISLLLARVTSDAQDTMPDGTPTRSGMSSRGTRRQPKRR